MSFPALVAFLLGAMLDPTTWVTAFLVTYAARKKQPWARIAISLLIVSAIFILMKSTMARMGNEYLGRSYIFAMFSTLIWCLIADAILRWRKRSGPTETV